MVKIDKQFCNKWSSVLQWFLLVFTCLQCNTILNVLLHLIITFSGIQLSDVVLNQLFKKCKQKPEIFLSLIIYYMILSSLSFNDKYCWNIRQFIINSYSWIYRRLSKFLSEITNTTVYLYRKNIPSIQHHTLRNTDQSRGYSYGRLYNALNIVDYNSYRTILLHML